MNDLFIAAIPFTAFVVFFLVWLRQLGQQNAAKRIAEQKRREAKAAQVAAAEAERAGVQIPA